MYVLELHIVEVCMYDFPGRIDIILTLDKKQFVYSMESDSGQVFRKNLARYGYDDN